MLYATMVLDQFWFRYWILSWGPSGITSTTLQILSIRSQEYLLTKYQQTIKKNHSREYDGVICIDVNHFCSYLTVVPISVHAVCFSNTVTSQWAPWRLKSPGSGLFGQPFLQAHIKEYSKAPCHWPWWGESTVDRWIPLNKGPVTRKCCHLMMSS